jgi:hypothetical protein
MRHECADRKDDTREQPDSTVYAIVPSKNDDRAAWEF